MWLELSLLTGSVGTLAAEACRGLLLSFLPEAAFGWFYPFLRRKRFVSALFDFWIGVPSDLTYWSWSRSWSRCWVIGLAQPVLEVGIDREVLSCCSGTS